MAKQVDYTDLIHMNINMFRYDRVGTLDKLRKEEGTMIELAKTLYEDPIILETQIERIKGRSQRIEELFATGLADPGTWQRIKEIRYERHSRRWIKKIAQVHETARAKREAANKMQRQAAIKLPRQTKAAIKITIPIVSREDALAAVHNLIAAAMEATRVEKAESKKTQKIIMAPVQTLQTKAPVTPAEASDVTVREINVKPVVNLSSREIMELGLFDPQSMDWDTVFGGSSQMELDLDVVDGSFSQVGAELDADQELETWLAGNLKGVEEGA